jgi:hypothetical protein
VAPRAPHNMHFTTAEFGERQERTRDALADQGLDGMLLFKIEDMYWLCGFDSDGFSIFHAMFIGADGELTHVSRGADLPNLRYSSVVDDVRIWVDAEGNPKSKAIKDLLASHKMQGKRVGIQLDTMGLTPRLYEEIKAQLDGWCELVDVSDLIRTLRLVKSPQELEYLRDGGAADLRALAGPSTGDAPRHAARALPHKGTLQRIRHLLQRIDRGFRGHRSLCGDGPGFRDWQSVHARLLRDGRRPGVVHPDLADGRDRRAPLERIGVAERGSSKGAEMTEETAGAPLKQLSEDPARPAGATLLT